MSKRISLAKLAKKVEEKKETKAATSSTTGVVITYWESSKAVPSSTKGVVIQEKQPWEEIPSTLPIKKGEVDDVKGKEKKMPLPDAKKAKSNKTVSGTTRPPASKEGTSARQGHPLAPEASVMASASMAKKIQAGVVLSTDRKKVEKLGLDQVVTKFLHCIVQIFTYFHSQLLFFVFLFI